MLCLSAFAHRVVRRCRKWYFTIHLTGIGHPFCRGCIESMPELQNGNLECPYCRSVIRNGLADFRYFHTIQRGPQTPLSRIVQSLKRPLECIQEGIRLKVWWRQRNRWCTGLE